jgi:hypothetical protein
MSDSECLLRIIGEPLDYLHPQRLSLPPAFQGPQARQVLNRILLADLDQGPWPSVAPTALAYLWIRQWRQLPYIASLMGAYRLLPSLAQGGVLQQLSPTLRKFAVSQSGNRDNPGMDLSAAIMPQIEAAGLNALWSWHDFVSPRLLARLLLQFSVEVVDLHRRWPVTEPDTTLFFMAVQHARLYPAPD